MSQPKLAGGVPEAAEMTPLAESTVWIEVSTGGLCSFKIGKRRLIRVAELDAYLQRSEVLATAERQGSRSVAP